MTNDERNPKLEFRNRSSWASFRHSSFRIRHSVLGFLSDFVIHSSFVPALRDHSSFLRLWLLLVCLCGCATSRESIPASTRHFEFQKDTLAYPNELVWEYYFD